MCFPLNSYQASPDREQIEQISKILGIPVMIGEFHFGASDVGLPAYKQIVRHFKLWYD